MRRWESAENHFKYIIFMSHLWIFPLFLLFASFSIQCSSGCGLPFRQFLTEQFSLSVRPFGEIPIIWMEEVDGAPKNRSRSEAEEEEFEAGDNETIFFLLHILAFRLHFFVLYYSRILDLSLSIRRRATHFSRLLLSRLTIYLIPSQLLK